MNCGFARFAIRESTPSEHMKWDMSMREIQFKQLFDEMHSYGIPERYFDSWSSNLSLFNDRCEKVLFAEMEAYRECSQYFVHFLHKQLEEIRSRIKSETHYVWVYRVLQYMQNHARTISCETSVCNTLQQLLSSPSHGLEASLSDSC